jgi:hypothetical protein
MVLAFLAGAKGPATRNELSQATGMEKGWSELLGAATREGLGVQGGGLEGRGLNECLGRQVGGKSLLYTITGAGRKAIEQAEKEATAN